MNRYLLDYIKEDLNKKMVFLGGPRQVGKTTLAKKLLKKSSNYLSWDEDKGRSKILNKEFPDNELIVFDELHKFKKWRAYLKGIYDSKEEKSNFLITGSARLDLYRHGGDSLQGRYHYWHMMPLSVAELKITTQNDLLELLNLGGFPDPFFSSSEREARRWSKEYRARLVRDEVSSLEQVSDLGSLEILYGYLPTLVGSPLSINNLREMLQVSHKTTSRWLDIIEKLYGMFRLAPFGTARIRAVKKEQKMYLYDWSVIADKGARFENFIAVQLLKYVYFLGDYEGYDIELRYYRDTTPREVDFVIVKDKKPILAVECKLSDYAISPHLRYFKSKFPECVCKQVVLEPSKEYVSAEGITVTSALKFLAELV